MVFLKILAKLRFVVELVDTLVQVAEQKENPLVAAMSNRKVSTLHRLQVYSLGSISLHYFEVFAERSSSSAGMRRAALYHSHVNLAIFQNNLDTLSKPDTFGNKLDIFEIKMSSFRIKLGTPQKS